MRHFLFVPAAGVAGLLIMMVAMAGESPGGLGKLVGDVGFWLICLTEAVLLSGWIVACEVADGRKWCQANAEETQKLVKLKRADLAARGVIRAETPEEED